MRNDKLKPCPFCGGKVKQAEGIGGLLFFTCTNYKNCGAMISFDNEELKYLRKQRQQDTNVIRPCPFCGKTPVTVVDDETEEKFGVKCFNCGGSIYPEKETLAEAIEAWNRRMSDGRFDQSAAGN